MAKRSRFMGLAVVIGTIFCTGMAWGNPTDHPTARPPKDLTGAWSYSHSESSNGSSWSESLSVAQSADYGPEFADIVVEEMSNDVTHRAHQEGVPWADVSTVLDKLVAQAKEGLPGAA